MSGLFFCRAFEGFGPNRLDPARKPPELVRVRGRRGANLRARVRAECPRQPGVYGMLGEKGELLYVGKAKCLRGRLLSYFRPRSRDPKAGRILERTQSIVWECATSEFAALLRELELIRRWQPRFNVQGQPFRRRRTYVCVGRRPAPYVFLSKQPPADALACYGPVPAGPRAREAVRRLNDWYRLRDCKQSVAMVFAEQAELFPVERAAGCLRYELGTCLGPCVGACTRSGYAQNVRAVRAFLAGNDPAPIQRLERAMQAAAEALQYERAQAYLDKLEPLRWLQKHLDRLRTAQEAYTFVYPVPSRRGRNLWYLVHRGRVVSAVRAPRDERERRAVADKLAGVFEASGPVPPLDAADVDGVLLVAGWFRRHPEELERTLRPAEALTACRAGA